jgi:2-dehydro-3-deoxyphosphogluconate aldolase/(4S)-4-hydroxy-2-oxoglutarate aldolase
MNREEVRLKLEEVGIIPAARVSSAEDARFAADAVAHGGICVIEITMTVPGALEVIADLARSSKGLIVGAGTVLDPETAQKCIDAGAQFITSPALRPAVIAQAHKNQVVAIPGVLTPTEVALAADAGSDFVKVFPCAQVGGASYIRALKRPFPDIRFIAAGGVNQKTAEEFMLAGASALGIGSELISKTSIQLRQPKRIQELARRYVAMVKAARAELVARSEREREATPEHRPY